MLPEIKTKVKANPIYHLKRGIKNALSTNAKSIIGLAVLQIIGSIIFAIALIGFVLSSIGFGFNGFGSNAPGKGAPIIIGAVIFSLLVFFFLVVIQIAATRILLTGVRLQKTSLMEAINFSKSRFGLVFQLVLLYLLAFIILITVSIFLPSPLGPLLSFIGGITLIVYSVRLIYFSTVIADDEKPASAIIAVNKGYSVLKKSVGATLMMMLLFIVIQAALNALTPQQQPDYGLSNNSTSSDLNFESSSSSSFSYSSELDDEITYSNDFDDSSDPFGSVVESTSTGLVLGAVILSILVGAILGILASAGFVSIYDEASQILGFNSSANTGEPALSSSAAAPQALNSPSPVSTPELGTTTHTPQTINPTPEQPEK